MNTENFIETKNGHSYLYSDTLRYFLFVPSKLKKVISNDSNDNYYLCKLEFMREHHFFDKEEVMFQTDYSEEQILKNLACLRQVLIEVTDCCNLKCKWLQRFTQPPNFVHASDCIDHCSHLREKYCPM